MQYLSKAYNYYSGINPATLSGAIDVIVVRSTDENGEDVLACSPFHVRFGKLRVLRATDKRVTLSMPNNLPEPHVAPFSMKVGETGEAFFVLETEDEVPLDLMTSPVITATDAGEAPPRPSIESPAHDTYETDPSASLTLQPFGATEHQVSHHGHNHDTHDTNTNMHNHDLQEVEPFDLNADPNDSPPSTKSSPVKHRRSESQGQHNQPVNPLAARPGEVTDLPIRDYKLRNLHTEGEELKLPKVKPGEHEGPTVKYGTDIVFDMGGFHRETSSEAGKPREGEGPSASNGDGIPEPKTPEMSSAPIDPSPPPRPKSPLLVKTAELESFVDDLMGTVGAVPKRDNASDLPSALESLSLESSSGLRSSPAAKVRRGDRLQSEPPEFSRPSSPTGDKAVSHQMDYAWDWGKIPDADEENERRQPHRSESLPPGDETGVHAPRASLRAVVSDPHVFLLELDGRVHLFELSLCGTDEFAPDCKADEAELDAFDKERLTYGRFMEDPNIVDDPRLVVYYDGLHMTWTTGYPLLFALAMFRRTQPSKPDTTPKGQQPRPSGYGWSRWWRGGAPSGVGIVPPPIEKTASAHEVVTKEKLEAAAPVPISASSPVSEAPSPTDSPALSPEQAIADEKHYAKTLRLSSDQLKQLNLKPGPNTVQFSVTSSYSGQAVVSARIFLWDELDQVIISDIDGTITKSDALGHVFAAIGRDWTHVGIANLYTDICNNGYKILYLTARAIGQADTTRDYLKTIVQGEYRMPEGPVIMSPDRLMASLHREVILRKPELFKMACLRDIQRLFASHAKDAFFAGFGNRITDAMSYRSVGIETGKIYTIDSAGALKTELLQSSHKGSYVGLNDLVNEMFPPVKTKVQPEFTDFTYWRDPIMDIALPDFSPPSPALSARSDASGNSRLSYIGGLIRRGSRAASPEATSQPASPRPSSPLIGPALTAADLSDDEDVTWSTRRNNKDNRSDSSSRPASMPGSYEEGAAFPAEWLKREDSKADFRRKERERRDSEDDDDVDDEQDYDDDDIFDDDILATGEMARVPF